jgi:chromosome segregation ATPase
MNAASTDARQNVANFPGVAAAVSRSGPSSALDLVSEAAGVIRGIQERAAESEARAKALAESALEKLQVAVSRIQSVEAARGSAQETISRLSAKLQEAEQELTRTQSRVAATERRLADAERQIQVAETRAVNAEKAVSQIEDAIRTQLVGLQENLTARSIRAA